MPNLTAVFRDLKKIMLPYADQLTIKIDRDDELNVDTGHVMKNGKPLWFGGVQIKKNYVSYHLMPIYLNPRLMEGSSAALKKHMQGKSCFNFTSSDQSLFNELAELTKAGFIDYKEQGYV